MIKFRIITIQNGEMLVPWYIYTCNHCGADIQESYPRYVDDERVMCPGCAFICGYVNEAEYLKEMYFMSAKDYRACVHDGKVYVHSKKHKFPWEKNKKEVRHSAEYTAWRTSVFERDDYTCKICGVRGGELNAHHIRPFAKYPKLRLDIGNGITLCQKCHKSVHKKRG